MTVKSGSAKRKTPRAGTKGVPREVREQQLIDAATRLFAQRGYEAVSVDDLAAEVGVTKPIVYAYFGSKEGLYAAGVHRLIEQCGARARAAAEGAGDAEQVSWRISNAFFEWVADNREHWPYVFGTRALGGVIASERTGAMTGMAELLVELVGPRMEGTPLHDEVETVAVLAVAVHTAVAERWMRHPEETLEAQALRAHNACWNGVRRLSAPAPQATPQERPQE
jgi:AcrR family transcriptional regulator